jgi:hypothetical protein
MAKKFSLPSSYIATRRNKGEILPTLNKNEPKMLNTSASSFLHPSHSVELLTTDAVKCMIWMNYKGNYTFLSSSPLLVSN